MAGESRPVTDADRERIIAGHAEGLSLGALALELGRSRSRISEAAKALGLNWDRAPMTRNAANARQADAALRRAELEYLMIEEAHRCLADMRSPATVVLSGIAGSADNKRLVFIDHKVDEPDATAKRNLMAAAALAVDKSLRIRDAHADPAGAAAVDQWLARMTRAAGDDANTA